MKAATIIRRCEALKSERSNVETVWGYLERFVMPFRGDFYHSTDDEGTVDWRRREIYDSTACDAAMALAASIQGNLVSPAVRWFDMRFQNEKLNENDEAKEWLQEASDTVFYALQDSNFNLETAETLLDVVGFGTGIIVEEYNSQTRGLEFTSVPLRECFFETSHRGKVKTFYRLLNWTSEQCLG